MKYTSEIEIDKLKYDLEYKRNLLIEAYKLKVYCPVAVYVKNQTIPDICKYIFFVHRFYELARFIRKLKVHLVQPCKKQLIIKTEDIDDDSKDFVFDDICIGELYEYEKNQDGFLYLKLDCTN